MSDMPNADALAEDTTMTDVALADVLVNVPSCAGLMLESTVKVVEKMSGPSEEEC